MTETLLAEISVVRALTPDGDEVDHVTAVDGNGDPLSLPLALTMMRAAEGILVDRAMGAT